MAYYAFQLGKQFPKTTSCSELDKQIKELLVNQDYWARQLNDEQRNATTAFLSNKKKEFATLKCDKTLISEKNAMIDYYINKYSALDKQRIESESYLQRNKRIFIGAGVLVVGLGILIYVTQKK